MREDFISTFRGTNKKAMKIQGIISAVLLFVFGCGLINEVEPRRDKSEKNKHRRQETRARKAHFRNVGKIVPYAKNVEVVLTLDFDAALKEARSVATELASHVVDLKDKHGKDNPHVRSLNITVQAGLNRFEDQAKDLAAILIGNTKRAFLEGLGTIVSLFQSWVNRGSITDLQHNEDVLHKEIGTNRGLVGKAAKTMGKLRDGGAADMEFMELSVEIQLGFEHLNAGLREMVEAAFQAAQGEVHRVLAPAAVLEEIKSHVYTTGSQKKLDPVFTHAAEFIGSPKSVMLGERGLAVVLHIPMVDQQTSVMTLYHLESVEVVREGTVERVQVEKPFLGKDVKGWRVTLGADELALCNKIGELYVCYHNRQLRRGVFDCASSLFDASQQGQWCSSITRKTSGSAITFMGGHYYYGRARDVTMKCGNESEDQDWRQVSYRPVPPICSAQGDDFVVLGGHSQRLKKSLTKAFAAPRDPGNFNRLPVEEGAAGSSLRAVETGLEIPAMEALRKTDWTVQILMYAGIGLGVLVVALVGVIVFLWRYNMVTRAKFVSGLAGIGNQWQALASGGSAEGNPNASSSSASAAGRSDSGLGSTLIESLSEPAKVKKLAAAVSEAAAAAAALKAVRDNKRESAENEEEREGANPGEGEEKAAAAARAAAAPQPGEFDPAARSSPKKHTTVSGGPSSVTSTFLLSR